MSSIDPSGEYGFSRRERQVVGELIAGLDNRSIAKQLFIAEDTVKAHLKAIFRKLGARDRAHAVALVLGTATVVVPADSLRGARARRSWTQTVSGIALPARLRQQSAAGELIAGSPASWRSRY